MEADCCLRQPSETNSGTEADRWLIMSSQKVTPGPFGLVNTNTRTLTTEPVRCAGAPRHLGGGCSQGNTLLLRLWGLPHAWSLQASAPEPRRKQTSKKTNSESHLESLKAEAPSHSERFPGGRGVCPPRWERAGDRARERQKRGTTASERESPQEDLRGGDGGPGGSPPSRDPASLLCPPPDCGLKGHPSPESPVYLKRCPPFDIHALGGRRKTRKRSPSRHPAVVGSVLSPGHHKLSARTLLHHQTNNADSYQTPASSRDTLGPVRTGSAPGLSRG